MKQRYGVWLRGQLCPCYTWKNYTVEKQMDMHPHSLRPAAGGRIVLVVTE
jgi:hypothetical protein